MGNMMQHNALLLGHYKQDPLNIGELVFWHPTDMFRPVLPTHHIVYNGGTGIQYTFETYAGKQCMHTVGASPGTNRGYNPSPISPQGAAFGSADWGISFWYYGRAASGSNIVQTSISSDPDKFVGTGVTLTTVVISSYLRMSLTGGAGTLLQLAVSNLTTGWNHIVYTGYSEGLRVYINKSLIKSVATTEPFGYIGQRCVVPNFGTTARIAHVRIYGKQLDTSDINALYDEA